MRIKSRKKDHKVFTRTARLTKVANLEKSKTGRTGGHF